MALHVTVVLPRVKTDPDAGKQVTGGLVGLKSLAVGPVQMTAGLPWVVARAVMTGPGTFSNVGGALSVNAHLRAAWQKGSRAQARQLHSSITRYYKVEGAGNGQQAGHCGNSAALLHIATF